MSSALDEFRAQREAVDDVRAHLIDVATLLRSLREETTALAQNEALRKFLQEQQSWLPRAEAVIAKARHIREWEVRRFWPAAWRRWAVAVTFALATTVASGAGYVWAARPYERELASLRARVQLGDSIARRVLEMTPAERRQFDALMKWNGPSKR